MPALGDFSLTATPHSHARGGGEKGSRTTIRFKVVYSAVISTFMLANADTDKDVQQLKEGDIIDLATLPPNTKLSVRGNTIPGKVGSVVFELSGAQSYKRTEMGAPILFLPTKVVITLAAN